MRTTTFLTTAVLLLGVRAADQTEADRAAIHDPTAECASYDYPPVTKALSSFPPIGTLVAGILAGDSAGQAKFNAMKGNIPNIKPKGTDGTISQDALSGYPPADADCWWSFTQCVTPKLAGLKPDIATMPEPRTLGYGFDDGPNCSHNAFYDYLTSKQQKATMFFIGTNVMYYPLEAQRAAVDGHEICVHSWSHHPMTALTNEQAFGELWYTMQAIKLVTGVTPTCWRPPQGDVDDRIRYIAQQLQLDNVLWEFDAFDWKVASALATPKEVQANYDDLISNMTSGAFNTAGAIFLTHELDNFTMQTAIDNYPKLAAAFDHIVPVGVGYNKTQPYAETNVSQPSFAAYIASRSGSGNASASGSASAGSPSGSGSAPGSSNTTAAGTSAGTALRLTSASVLSLALGLLGATLIL
ncbi:carbohydrate esterase family 4 protein [Mycena vitilis]|nr:carbohydrate esterase family 4 protein [Mycena vitilis]